MVDRAGNDTALVVQLSAWFASKDCVCLTRSCLAVRHYYSVESIQNVLHYGLRELRIGDSLVTLHIEHVIEHIVSPVEPRSYQ